ncbi:TetR/AcrR family transcriptional regulator [Actinomadura kijaniata]|uniref:TetR/AcrR family transcriptional regulator n=1 Tax=Actinomadura kijaniata TaxID=46161 RepID=UPI003F1CC616
MTRRRSDTRERIRQTALELFLERGYDQTSLREIAERLGVTKAALYYHFKTKEELVASLGEGVDGNLAELVEWGRSQPRTPEVRRELLRRLSVTVSEFAPIARFFQENQAALRTVRGEQRNREHMAALTELITPPDPSTEDRIRAVSALFSVFFGPFALEHLAGDPEANRATLLKVAAEILRLPDPG